MGTDWKILGGTGLFMVPWALVYAFTSSDEAGTLLLFMSAAALLFLAAYLFGANRHGGTQQDPLEGGAGDDPEDAVDLGVFPTASIWPFVLGLATTTVAFGLVFTNWMTVFGVVVAVAALGAMAAETRSRRP